MKKLPILHHKICTFLSFVLIYLETLMSSTLLWLMLLHPAWIMTIPSQSLLGVGVITEATTEGIL